MFDLAQALTARAARNTDDPLRRAGLIDAYAALVALAAEAPTANFDPGMLPFENRQLACSPPPPLANPPMAETDTSPFYITTAISYPNGRPHIGHAYEGDRSGCRRPVPAAHGPPRAVPDRHRRTRVENGAQGGRNKAARPAIWQTRCRAISVRCAMA